MNSSIKKSFQIGFLLLLLTATNSFSQALFERGFGTAEDDVAHAICKTNDGGYVTAGYTKGYSASLISYPFIVKFSHEGKYVWSSYISTPAGLSVQGITEDASGNLIGCASGGFQYWSQASPQTVDSDSLLVFKLSATGTLIWQQYVYGTQKRKCRELTLTPAGDILIASSILQPSGKVDASIVKMSGSGVFQGEKTYSSFGNNEFTDVTATDDGNYLFCSMATDTLFNDYVYIVKSDALGDSLWTRHHYLTNRASNNPSSVNAIVELDTKEILIGGNRSALNLTYPRSFLLQLDSTATVNTNPSGGVTSPSASSDMIRDIATSIQSDEVFATNWNYSFGSKYNVLVYNPQTFDIGSYMYLHLNINTFDVHYHMREANALVTDYAPPLMDISGVTAGSTRLSGYGKEDFALVKTFGNLSSINFPRPVITNHGGNYICQGDSTLLTLDANGRDFHRWANIFGQNNAEFDLGISSDSLWVTESGYYMAIAFDADSNIYTSNVIQVSIGSDTIRISHTLPLAFCAAAGQPDSTVLYVSNITPALYPATYQWYKNDIAVSGATDSFYVAKTFGTYKCSGATICGPYTTNKLSVIPNASPASIFTRVAAIGLLSNCNTQSFGWFGNDTTTTFIWYDSTGTLIPYTGATYAPGFPTTMYGKAVNACGSDSLKFTSTLKLFLIPGPSAYLNCATNGVQLRIDNSKPATSNISWYFNGTVIPGANLDTLTVYQSGNYEAHFEDTLCPGIVNIQSCTVFPPSVITPFTLTSADTLLCPGEFSTTINAPNIPAVNYEWKRNGLNYSPANIYNPVVTDGGVYQLKIYNACAFQTGSITILRDTLVAAITALGATSFCQGDSVILSAPSSFASYQWYNYNSAIQGATNINYAAKGKGKYKCITQSVATCTDTSNVILVDVPCIQIGPIYDRSSLQTESPDISIFPNPGSGLFTLLAPPGRLEIFSSIGDLIYSVELHTPENSVDLSGFAEGIYFIQLKTAETIYNKKIVVSR